MSMSPCPLDERLVVCAAGTDIFELSLPHAASSAAAAPPPASPPNRPLRDVGPSGTPASLIGYEEAYGPRTATGSVTGAPTLRPRSSGDSQARWPTLTRMSTIASTLPGQGSVARRMFNKVP